MNFPVNGLPRRGTALLLALVAALLLFRLADVPLVGPDEPRYARVAVEMHRSGHFGIPTLAGQPWLEKPALYYWMAASAMSVLGENEAAARVPSVLACLAWVLAAVYLGSRLYGRSAGLHAGFVLGTSLLGFVYGRAAAMDMLLAATVTWATGLFGLIALEGLSRRALPLAYAVTGLAVLAKGPLGLLLPVLVLGAHLALTRDRPGLRRLLSLRGALLFLIITAPWYAYVLHSQGQAFLEVFFLNHNLRRFFSTIHQHPGPFYYYVPVVLASLFPWSGVALPALARLSPRASAADRFVLIWLLVPLVFFSAAGSKLPGYILPCLAPVALAIGRWATTATRLDGPPARRLDLRLCAGVGLVAGGCALAAPWLLARRGETVWPLLVPACAWALITMLLSAWRLFRDVAGALAVVRVAGAGFLLLLTSVAPTVLSRLDSGRDLFALAHGQEVLVWGARRTVWMSGYFYNDAKVREVETLDELLQAASHGPVLALCGPEQASRLERAPIQTERLAVGARGATLIRLYLRAAAPPESPDASAS